MNKFRKLSTEEELELIDYYKTHSVLNTAQHFIIPRSKVTTILDKYHVEKHSKEYTTKLGRTLYKENNLQKYGVLNTGQLPEVIAKRRQTMLERYGVENPYQAEAIKEKIKKANIEKYGVASYTQTEECQEKIKQTCVDKYGCDNPMKNPEIALKSINAKIDKYGTLRLSHKMCYSVDNEVFDSFPELCFYLYCLAHNIEIAHEDVILEYFFNGTTHRYTPDFRIGNTLIEIKGHHLVNELGEWVDAVHPERSAQAEAKHQCALANNVKIMYKEEYQFYIDWFKNQQLDKEQYKNK